MSDSRREFLLAALRQALLRAKLMENELTMIGVSLKHGTISNEEAMQWLHEEGLMFLIPQYGRAEGNGYSTGTSVNGASES